MASTEESNLLVEPTARNEVSIAARDTTQLLAGRGCFVFVGYLVSVALARGLGPHDYGVYGVILSTLVWIEMVATAGIPGATAKLIPYYERQTSAVEQAARALLLTSSLLLFFGCWLLAPVFSRLFNIPEGTTLFRLAILDLPLSAIYAAYQGALNGQRRFGRLSVCLIIYSLTKLVGIFSLFFFRRLLISSALIVNILATASVLAYLLIKFPPIKARPTYATMISITRLALPFGLFLVAWQILLSLDLWLLTILWTGPGKIIGLYVAALNISKMMSIFSAVVGDVLFASLCWALARKDENVAQKHIQAAVRLALIILVPSSALLVFHAEAVMALIYSNAYSSGGTYLYLQLLAFVLLAFFDIFLNALCATGRYYYSVVILFSLIPVALLLNFVFIPQFGAIGAAAALALTICLGTNVAAVSTYRRFGSLVKLSTVMRVILATGLMILIAKYVLVTGPWLLVKFLALLLFYFLLLALAGELRREDLNAFALWQKRQQEAEIKYP